QDYPASTAGGKDSVGFRVNEAEGNCFVESHCRQRLSDRAPRVLSRKKTAGSRPCGQCLVNQIVSNVAGDLFDEVNLPADIHAKRRGDSAQPVFFGPDLDREFECPQYPGRLLDSNVETRYLFYSSSPQHEWFPLHWRRIDIDHTFQDAASGYLLNQHCNPVRGAHLGSEVGPALKAVRGLGVEPELPGCSPDGVRVEVSRLDQNVGSTRADLRVFAAHDSG